MSLTIPEIFERIRNLKVLVIGDVMLDRYIWGQVDRISPEAPVPVVDIRSEENRLGGAANVAANLKAMGATTLLCGAIGKDRNGESLLEIMHTEGFATDFIFPFQGRRTTTKTRVISSGQHMLRVDWEDTASLSEAEVGHVLASVFPLIAEVDVVIFEDYDKGMLSPDLIHNLVAEAVKQGVPTVVDPKFRNFFAYEGTTLFKPNLKELNEGLGLRVANGDLEGVEEAGNSLREKMPHHHTLITLGKFGMTLIDAEGKSSRLEAHQRKIIDVSGAGDTVVALLALALGAGLAVETGARIANLGGGLVCEEVGVVPVDPLRLQAEMERLGMGG